MLQHRKGLCPFTVCFTVQHREGPLYRSLYRYPFTVAARADQNIGIALDPRLILMRDRHDAVVATKCGNGFDRNNNSAVSAILAVRKNGGMAGFRP